MSAKTVLIVNSIHFTLGDDSTTELVDAVNSILRGYNEAENPAWWKAMDDPANEPRPVNVFAFNDANQLIGGLSGETCLLWLKVRIMAVHEEHRGLGIGRRLLATAEAEAIKRGCKYAFLDTMQFQAPEFYQRRGYQVAARIEDWDSNGHAKFFLKKTLGGDRD